MHQLPRTQCIAQRLQQFGQGVGDRRLQLRLVHVLATPQARTNHTQTHEYTTHCYHTRAPDAAGPSQSRLPARRSSRTARRRRPGRASGIAACAITIECTHTHANREHRQDNTHTRARTHQQVGQDDELGQRQHAIAHRVAHAAAGRKLRVEHGICDVVCDMCKQ
jgi:hypothetical protein